MLHNQGHFTGFPPEGLALLAELAVNNNCRWFAAHKAAYQNYLLAPAQAFITTLGSRLQAIAPDIRVDPRTDGAGVLLRIYRDARFSRDPAPYKTNISIETEQHDGQTISSIDRSGLPYPRRFGCNR